MRNDTAYRQSGSPVGGPTANRKKTNLGKEAVKAALNGEWERAAAVNRAILELSPNDCEAANRLAKALMELGNYPEARKILETLRVRAPSNNIARKNLARLEQLQDRAGDGRRAVANNGGLPPVFIAESGKSCITTLRKRTDASGTVAVSAGDVVSLSVSGDDIAAISRDGIYLGTVERRLSRRLQKLMAGGNQYAAAVVGTGADGLSIMVREIRQDPALRHVVSFPPAYDNARHRPAAVVRSTLPEAYDEEVEANPDHGPDVRADEDDTDDESVAAIIAEDVADDPAEDDDVPVLDDDVDNDVWMPVESAAEGADDWE